MGRRVNGVMTWELRLEVEADVFLRPLGDIRNPGG